MNLNRSTVRSYRYSRTILIASLLLTSFFLLVTPTFTTTTLSTVVTQIVSASSPSRLALGDSGTTSSIVSVAVTGTPSVMHISSHAAYLTQTAIARTAFFNSIGAIGGIITSHIGALQGAITTPAVVHNAAEQIAYYTTVTITPRAGATATAYLVLAGLPSGTYSVTTFATTPSGTAISATSTASIATGSTILSPQGATIIALLIAATAYFVAVIATVAGPPGIRSICSKLAARISRAFRILQTFGGSTVKSANGTMNNHASMSTCRVTLTELIDTTASINIRRACNRMRQPHVSQSQPANSSFSALSSGAVSDISGSVSIPTSSTRLASAAGRTRSVAALAARTLVLELAILVRRPS